MYLSERIKQNKNKGAYRMHPIENIMQTSMEQIKRMVDVNTVVGNPIVTAGNTMILPVSKLSLSLSAEENTVICAALKRQLMKQTVIPVSRLQEQAPSVCASPRWHLSPRNREMFVLCLLTERARQTDLWT